MMLNKRYFLLIILLVIPFMKALPQTSDESWKVYDDTQLGRVDITIKPAYMKWLYANVSQDSEFVATMHFKNKYIDQTIDSVGFRLRGGTSRNAQKKSFKVSLNSFLKGTKLLGVEKLNFNGDHNDPSIIRSKLSFDLFKAIGLPAARAAHIQVYINGQYYGLYVSVEQLDETFLTRQYKDDTGNLWKCLWPADLHYKDDNPFSYSSMMNGSAPVYELSTNQAANDFMPLVRLIKLINNTPTAQLEDSVEAFIDVADVLHYFATNVTIGGWDDYWGNMNNYYLYYEPEIDKFHIIPYDYDNTFGIDWSSTDWSKANPYAFPQLSSGARPLAQKIIALPEYRNLYTHFIDFFRTNVFALSQWESHIDSLKTMITPAAIADSFRTLDYRFTVADFNNSYSATSYANQQAKMGLKQYINARNASLSFQLTYILSKPVAYKIGFAPRIPSPSDSIQVTVSAYSNLGLDSVLIHFKPTGAASETLYPMSFSPVANTKKVEEADRYIGMIPPLGKNGTGVFYIEVRDKANQSLLFPRKGGYTIKTATQSSDGIVINEFLADEKLSTPNPSGEHVDWLELYNTTSSPVKLTGKYLADNPQKLNKWRFTKDSLYLGPHQFLVVWCDNQLTEPGIHANFKLSKSGEYIAYVDTDAVTVIDSLSFGQQATDISYGRLPDGSANWTTMSPTPGSANLLTDIKTKSTRQMSLELSAYPNPFNPGSTIRYNLPAALNVKIKVYDMLGNEIKTLVSGEVPAGSHEVYFDGSSFASGVYFCRLTSGTFVKTVKLQLLK